MRISDKKEEVLQNIASALEKLRYGSVEIQVHDSKVVQIEVKEKFRFEKQKDPIRQRKENN